MRLQGKIALITGASRGIGRAIAIRLAKDGVLIAINYQKNAEAAAEVIREIETAGGEAFAVQGDVASVAGVENLFQSLDSELTKRRGSSQFDILVNNAGIGTEGTIESTTEEIFDEVFGVNVKGPFFVTQQACSRLLNGGRIINLSSALSRSPYSRMIAYSMGKAAINHFTLILAADLGKRSITVNAIAPGLTATDLTASTRQNPQIIEQISSHTALGRIGEVTDIAGVAAFLASEEAGWVTGQYIEASGGIGLA